MEDWQKQHISNNFDRLIEDTRYDTTLAAKLLSKGVFSEGDVANVDSLKVGQQKSSELYKIVATRSGGFATLIEVLEESKQTGAAKILREAVPSEPHNYHTLPRRNSRIDNNSLDTVIERAQENCESQHKKEVESLFYKNVEIINNPNLLKAKEIEIIEQALCNLETQLSPYPSINLTREKQLLRRQLNITFNELKTKYKDLILHQDKLLHEYNCEIASFKTTCTSNQLLQDSHFACLDKKHKAYVEFCNTLEVKLPTEYTPTAFKKSIEESFQRHRISLSKQLKEDGKLDMQLLYEVIEKYHAEMKSQFTYQTHLRDTQVQEIHDNACTLAIRRCIENDSDSLAQAKEFRQTLDKHLPIYQKKNEMAGAQNEPAIGIDLGTVNCCVAVFLNGNVQTIPSPEGYKSTPSYVGYDSESKVKAVGCAAKRLALENPCLTIYDSKRIIGRRMNESTVNRDRKNWPFVLVDDHGYPKYQINDDLVRPEDIAAQLLIECRLQAERFLGCPVRKAVITVPAYFNDDQKTATISAGRQAQLEVLTIINEPTAAGIAYAWDKVYNRETMVLVFDLGGGTFDVALIKVDTKNIRVLAFHGDTHLGGIDIDNELINYCIDDFKASTGIDLNQIDIGKATADERLKIKRNIQRLHNTCETVKRELSTCDKSTIFVESIINGQDLKVEMTKKKLDSMCDHLYKNMLDIVDKLLKKENVAKNVIDEIIMIGGSTRIPQVQNLLRSYFDKKTLNFSINPDEAVAYGAAVQAAISNGEKFQGMLVKIVEDVIPMSIGIECIFEGQTGRFYPILKKNSKYPTEGNEVFFTSRDDQDSGQVYVYQGDDKYVRDNHFIGSYIYRGIPKGKKGSQTIRVVMKITVMGTLDVEILCESTSKLERVHLGQVALTSNTPTVSEVTKDKIKEPQIQ